MSDMSTKDSFEAGIAVLRAGFIAKFPKFIDSLAALVTAADEGHSSEEALDEIAKLAHRLRGVCGTIGLSKMGTDFGRIEDRLTAGLANGEPAKQLLSAISDPLCAVLDEMEIELDAG